jgi:hypothetical protein
MGTRRRQNAHFNLANTASTVIVLSRLGTECKLQAEAVNLLFARNARCRVEG